MTYNEYIAQEQQAIDEEHSDDSCFLTDTPECQFVRGHYFFIPEWEPKGGDYGVIRGWLQGDNADIPY